MMTKRKRSFASILQIIVTKGPVVLKPLKDGKFAYELYTTVLCISNFTVFGKLAVVFLSVKIQKIFIYSLKDQKNCHKFKHQNLQNSQGYQNFRLDFTYDQFSNKEIQKTQLFDKIFETHRVLTNQLVPLEYKVSRKNIHL